MNSLLMKSNLQQEIILLYFGLNYYVNFSYNFDAVRNQFSVVMINLIILDKTVYNYYMKKENKD